MFLFQWLVGAASEENQNFIQRQIIEINNKIEELKKRDVVDKTTLNNLIIEQRELINEILAESNNTPIPCTAKRYDENLAFINIETTPENSDVYINDIFVGKAPVKLYEIEANIPHKIVICGDPRYYWSKVIEVKLKKFQREKFNISLEHGRAKIIVLADEVINRVAVDGKLVKDFNENTPVVVLEAGKHKIKAWRGFYYSEFQVDLWEGDFLRLNANNLIYDKELESNCKLCQEAKKQLDKMLDNPDKTFVARVFVLDQWYKNRCGELYCLKSKLDDLKGLGMLFRLLSTEKYKIYDIYGKSNPSSFKLNEICCCK